MKLKMKNGLEIVVKQGRSVSDEEIMQLNLITANCFGKEVPLEETRKQFEEAELLSLLMLDNTIKGYGLNSHLNLDCTQVNYFGSGFIDPEFQDRKLYSQFTRVRTELIVTPVIMTRTQNPKVFSGFTRLCQDRGLAMSPDSQGNVNNRSLELAKTFSNHGGGAFDSSCDDMQICRGLYGRELMANTPLPNDTTRRVMGELDVPKGDAIILVGGKQY